MNYTFRMHDPRVGRFFAIDPLSKQYPHNSPYAFAENRVIDGVELEGLEFLDHNVSRIKMTYGAAMINLDNVNGATYNMLHTNVYNEWDMFLYRYPKQNLVYLGRYIYEGTLVKEDTRMKFYAKSSESPFLEQDDLMAEGKTLKHPDKYNSGRSVTLSTGPIQSAKGAAAVAIIETAHFAINQLKNYLVTEDVDLITEHRDILIKKVLPAIKLALKSKTKTYIPSSMRNTESLSLIANVILFGGDGSKKYTKDIMNTGMNIFYDLTKEGRKEKAKNSTGNSGTKKPSRVISPRFF